MISSPRWTKSKNISSLSLFSKNKKTYLLFTKHHSVFEHNFKHSEEEEYELEATKADFEKSEFYVAKSSEITKKLEVKQWETEFELEATDVGTLSEFEQGRH